MSEQQQDRLARDLEQAARERSRDQSMRADTTPRGRRTAPDETTERDDDA